jgi:TPP-dependent pyruvate/acetoin dehydrogenase alpha subunit
VTDPGCDAQFLLELYRRMVRIRHFEERVKFLFLEGVMPGTIHQCQGQEACAVGVCAALEKDDVIATGHRPHGHCLAKGMTVHGIMAELFGKATGCCKGKGGSMHIGDLAQGVIPAIAIVGGNIPVTAGAALAFKLGCHKRVAVSFMGDGAVNEGIFHESLNMAALWDLPAVFVVENNLYAASTHVSRTIRTETIAERASIYRMPGERVDGNDVIAVYQAARQAVDRARRCEGPTLLELMTYRITGHSRRDPALYQPDEERKGALANEPIGRFETFLFAHQFAKRAQLDEIAAAVDLEIEEAVTAAMSAPEPKPEDTLEDLFVERP